jgi:NDP-sugar pyrophosphorylase family protein
LKAVVLAGGKGTRLAPYTKVLPKALMPIGDMPILEILLRQMQRSGIDEVILTVGHLAQLLRAFFQDGSQFNLKIRYSVEDTPLGTAGPLSLVEGLDDTYIVTNGDVLTNLDLRTLVAAHRKSGATATIAMHARQVKVDLGVLELDKDNQVTGYLEKPAYDFHVSMGIYVFEPSVLDYVPYCQYLDFPDLVLKMIQAGERVMGYPYDGYWQDLGRQDDYEQAVMEFDAIKSTILGED